MKKMIIVLSLLALITACNDEKKVTTQQVTYAASSQDSPTQVPEPSSITLLALGIIGIVGLRKSGL
ncbi:MAG TPA: PEP-CTERM sorting domain-containing protein [Syntrophales bacterium]|nr:PEP-CTERM sorting domain-containing protein [Syntrophales bacterium]